MNMMFNEMLMVFSTYNKHLQFTYEWEQNDSISFLEVLSLIGITNLKYLVEFQIICLIIS